MILITGATGLVGGALVRRLAAAGIPARALVRDPARAGDLVTLPGITIVVGDLGRPETLTDALRGVDRAMLISSSVPEMQAVQCAFVDAARAAGVAHVVKLSGIIPERTSPFRFARMHGEIELHLERSGMAWTHLRAGEFMQSYFRHVRPVVERGILPLPMADQRIASIDAADVARVAAAALTQPGHASKIYPITGPDALGMDDVAAVLSHLVGKPVRYVDVEPDVAKQAQLAAGFPPYLVDALGELFAERRKGAESVVYATIPEVFGWQPTSFAEFAERHVAVFRG